MFPFGRVSSFDSGSRKDSQGSRSRCTAAPRTRLVGQGFLSSTRTTRTSAKSVNVAPGTRFECDACVMREDVYWYARTERHLASRLEADIQADAVVVGGGMAGLATAQWLCERTGLDVVVVEAAF